MSPNHLLDVTARLVHGTHQTHYAREKGRLTGLLVNSRAWQRGYYDLLSIGIGATIAIAFATVGLWQKREEMLSQQMAAQGNVLADIGNSINGKYLSIYYSNLVNGTAIPGVADEYAPTMAELEAINVVPAGYSTTSAYGTPYVVSLAKAPTGCVAPACDIAGMVYINGAITDPSTGRPLTLDDSAAAIGGDGGYSDLLTPGTIAGPDGGWSLPNPMGNVAGILAMRVGYGSSGWSAYVRRDGSLPMEGDLNFKGTTGTLHNIANAATVNAQKVVTPSGNSVQIGSSFLYGDGTNSAIRQSGALYVQNSAGTAAADVNAGNVNASASVNATSNVNASGSMWSNGQITTNSNVSLAANGASVMGGGQLQVNANGPLYLNPWSGGQTIVGGGGGSGQLVVAGRLYANEYIQPNGVAAPGGACSPNGLIANSGSGPLFCQSGVWQAAGNVPTGTMCGGVTINGYTGQPAGGGTIYQTCQGMAFMTQGCPSGYYLATPYAADANWFYTCIKS